MQLQYPMLSKVEVEMTQEKEMDELPNRPSKFGSPTYLLIKIYLSFYLWFDLFS